MCEVEDIPNPIPKEVEDDDEDEEDDDDDEESEPEGLLKNELVVVEGVEDVEFLSSPGNWACAIRTPLAAMTQKTPIREKVFIFFCSIELCSLSKINS